MSSFSMWRGARRGAGQESVDGSPVGGGQVDRLVRLILYLLAAGATLAGLFLFASPARLNLSQSFSLAGLIMAAGYLAFLAVGARFVARSDRPLIFVAAVFLVSRAAAAWLLSGANHPLGTDPGDYLEIAKNILAGNGILTRGYYAVYPPLYPVALSGVAFIVGLNAVAVTMVNAAFDVGSALTICALAKGRQGRAAAFLYLMWPTFVLGAAIAQKESLGIFLCLQIALSFVRQQDGFRPKESLRLGAAVGLLALTQPALATLVVALALVFVWKIGLGNLIRIAAVAAPLCLVVLIPWWVRNWMLFHAFVPLTNGSGYSFLIAVTGRYDVVDPYWRMPEMTATKAAAHAAFEVIRANPLAALQHRVTSMAQAFLIEDFAGVRLQWMGFAASALGLTIPLCQGAYVSALWAAARRLESPISLLILACLIQFFLFNLPFEFAERHRYPMTPFLLIAAASYLMGRRPAVSAALATAATDRG